MYKKILVAIDDSETSRCALGEAIHIARNYGAKLCILHIVDETLMGLHHRTITTTLNLDHARQALCAAGEALLGAAKEQAGGVEVETRLIEDRDKRISQAIVEAAEAWRADLLVAGTHGRRGLQLLIIGSVAEQLSRLATMSLLLVRKH